MLVQIQAGLERLDGGSTVYFYAVKDQVVLKSPGTFVPTPDDSSPIVQHEYAVSTVCHDEDIENERIIPKRLKSYEHCNILRTIS